jgi:hypothetical protein
MEGEREVSYAMGQQVHLVTITNDLTFIKTKTVSKQNKGSPVHVVPACAGFGEGSDHFGPYVHSLKAKNKCTVKSEGM